jgi:hypothetical protein
MNELSPKVEEVYRNLVEKFKLTKNKSESISIMLEFCNRQDTTNMDVYTLKKKMEIQFSIDVDCKYCYTVTPVNYGCDLREIFFDRENNLTENGQSLLDVFERKKIDDVYHIMTDIDDTLYPNTEHGTYIAGSDISWHSKTPYPGIIKFYNLFYNKLSELSRYSTVLSATPGCLKNSKIIKKKESISRVLGDFGFIQGEESKTKYASFAPGIISNFFSKQGSNYNSTSNLELYTYLGNMKFERFKQYLKLFPEYKIFFIGDNGQGDVIAGKQMLQHAPNRCKVFIHRVCEDGQNFKVPSRQDNGIQGLSFFKTYNDLGKIFQEIGIFNENDILELTNKFNEEIQNPINTTFKHLYVADYKQPTPEPEPKVDLVNFDAFGNPLNGGRRRKTRKTRKTKKTRKTRKTKRNKKSRKNKR